MSTFDLHEKSKFWSEKNDKRPNQLALYSKEKFIFNCDICAHEFLSNLSNVSSGYWCPYCSKPPKKLCEDDNCEKCFKKSFFSHKKSEFWSNCNSDKPRQVFINSNKKYYFDCKNCNHTFESKITDINKNQWCPYCSKPPKKLCENNKCNFCFNNSFASNEKSKYWSAKNNINPRNIFKSVDKKFIFNCKCGHEFTNSLDKISIGKWCPFCSIPIKKLCNKNDCNLCFKNSFASNEKSQYWSKLNIIQPRNVSKSSDKKFIFNCDKNHKFEISLDKISAGQWCSICKNKTEKKVYDILKNNYPDLVFQYQIKNTSYKFDFALLDSNIIIELDGRQHFEQVKNWINPEKQHEIDIIKMKLANDNNFSVIRLLQEDVYYNKYDWLKELKKNIEFINCLEKIHNIYICKNNEYSIFKL